MKEAGSAPGKESSVGFERTRAAQQISAANKPSAVLFACLRKVRHARPTPPRFPQDVRD